MARISLSKIEKGNECNNIQRKQKEFESETE